MELLNTKLMKFKAYKKLDKNNKTLSEANASLFLYGSLPGDSHVALLLRMT